MLAINEAPTRYETPAEPIAVEVWVAGFPHLPTEHGPAEDGWYFGQLSEWTHYESVGWTGWVRFSLGPSRQHIGTFLAEAIRRYEDE